MLNVKPYRQKPGKCGPASLKMVLGYYGIEKTEDELSEMANYSEKNGTKAKDLINVAKKLGFKAFQKDYSKIQDLKEYVANKKIPVIVDWFSENDGHYSVAVSIDNENIYLQDPELGGLRIMDLDTFNRVWFDFEGNFLNSKNDIIIRRMIAIYK